VSIDGGKTFTDHIVYNNPTVTVAYGHQFVNATVDRGGNVYVLYSDNRNLFYSFSTNFGRTWSGPWQINRPPANTAIFPWASGGSAGALDVVWYGTSFYDGVTVPDDYPMTAAWYVYFAQNLQATTPGSSFTAVKASGIIHYGGVCEGGVTCTAPANRDLLDDFGVAASPTTGRAAIIYTSDQFVGTAAEPARTQGSTTCNASTNNSSECSHTDIAVQTGGSGVNTRRHLEIVGLDFEETGVPNLSMPAPSFKMQVADTGGMPITSLAVQVAGLPLAVSWNSPLPLPPGQVASGATFLLPAGLSPVIGDIYPITLTATLADGTIETLTSQAIYTLGAGLGL
jgi:hypothetical protein